MARVLKPALDRFGNSSRDGGSVSTPASAARSTSFRVTKTEFLGLSKDQQAHCFLVSEALDVQVAFGYEAKGVLEMVDDALVSIGPPMTVTEDKERINK
jgi:hypothetical protein